MIIKKSFKRFKITHLGLQCGNVVKNVTVVTKTLQHNTKIVVLKKFSDSDESVSNFIGNSVYNFKILKYRCSNIDHIAVLHVTSMCKS